MVISAFLTGESIHSELIREKFGFEEDDKFESLQLIYDTSITKLGEEDYDYFQKVHIHKGSIEKVEERKGKIEVTIKDEVREVALYDLTVRNDAHGFLVKEIKEGEYHIEEKYRITFNTISNRNELLKIIDISEIKAFNNTLSRAPNCPPY